MVSLAQIGVWLGEQLPAMLPQYDIPAVAIAVSAGDDVVEYATGVLNKRTGVGATTDSVFQIGSITKTWTATLVMQLVDDGLLDLDASVRAYLPDFRVADVVASEQVTVRQLLSHTSGVEGDIFARVGRGDDSIERFVADELPGAPQLFPPGRLFSYSNTSGYVVLGRIVELLRGRPFREVLLDRLAKPLGLQTVSPRAEDAIRHRAAMGHVPAGGRWQPADVWTLGDFGLPSGLTLAMSARDLLGFAHLHLRDGLAADGTRLLSAESAHAMRTAEVQCPPLSAIDTSYGLGWSLETWQGGSVIGHNGGTIGQSSRLRAVPEAGVAIAILANGGRPRDLYNTVLAHVVRELTGIEMPPAPVPPVQPEPVEPARYVGRYEAAATRIDIEADSHGRLWRVFYPKGELDRANEQTEPERDRIVRLRDDTFMTAYEDGSSEMYAFVGTDEAGRAAFLHLGVACPRVGP